MMTVLTPMADAFFTARSYGEAAVYTGREALIYVRAGDAERAREAARYAARFARFREEAMAEYDRELLKLRKGE